MRTFLAGELMVDFEDMRLFVRAVGEGGLSAAGRELGLSPAADVRAARRFRSRAT